MIDFDEAYMKHRLHIAWRGPVIAESIIKVLNPKTAYDFGCATGDIAKGLLDRGIDVYGFDSSPFAGGLLPPERFVWADLRHIILYGNVDLGVLLETLTIMSEPEHEQVLIRILRSCKQLLVNGLTDSDCDFLWEQGCSLNIQKGQELRDSLAPLGTRQAIKALFRTGEVWDVSR